MTAVNIYRGTTGVVLPTTFSGEIWQGVQEASAAFRLTEAVDLPGTGLTIDVITGDPTPDWVSETEEAGVSRGTISTDLMTPYTLSTIVPFSNKFRRDKRALYNAMANRLPLALAKKIDATIFTGTTPGTNFDVLSGADGYALNAVAGTVDDVDLGLVKAKGAVVAAIEGIDPNGIVYSPRLMGMMQEARDENHMPKYPQGAALTEVLGQPLVRSFNVYKANGVDSTHDVVGIMGDWSYAKHGVVQGITVSMSDQATLTDGAATINLWQRGMFALKVEAEVGFVVRDAAAFRRLTELTAA